MLDANPYISILFDKNLSILDCNSTAMEYFGFTSKEEFKSKILRFIKNGIPEYQPSGEKSVTIEQRVLDVIKMGTSECETELRIGEQKMNFNIVMRKIDVDDSFFIAAYLIDLSSLHQAKNELQHQDSLLRTVNNMASMLLKSDPETFKKTLWDSLKMLGVNIDVDRVYIWRNFERGNKLYMKQIFEWSEGAEPQQGKDFVNQIPYDETPYWHDTLSKGLSINSVVKNLPQAEQDILNPQGIISILVLPIFISGKFWGFVGFDNCKSERLFSPVEEHILHSSGVLLVSAILRNETTDSLIVAREAALESANAKSRFLANMSHEIRTPMNAIIGMATIARESGDPQKINDCLDKIDIASKHLLGIINDVLDMSKIEARKFQLSEDEVSVERLIKNICSMHMGRVQEKNQKLIVDYDEDIPPCVIADETRLSQVVTNLLSNAIKFTPVDGVIRLIVVQLTEDTETTTIQVVVEDTGICIKPEHLKLLFNPFEQGAAGISRNFGGTGLGLAISRSIIESMGGKIDVDSEFGVGSRFRFTVTLTKGSSDFTLKSSDETSADSYDFSGKTVLLVEDLEINRLVVESLLEPTGITIISAENGKIACDMFTTQPEKYDLIYMDMHMPVMNGLEATKNIRAADVAKSKDIPIIAMTANAFTEDIAACKEAGMNDHLAKPLDVAELLRKTSLYLSEK